METDGWSDVRITDQHNVQLEMPSNTTQGLSPGCCGKYEGGHGWGVYMLRVGLVTSGSIAYT